MVEQTPQLEAEGESLDFARLGWCDPAVDEIENSSVSTETPETGSNDSPLDEAADETAEEDDFVYFVPNPLVQRCISAWVNTLTKERMRLDSWDLTSDPKVNKALAREAAEFAYCAALPQLSNRQNVTDFIACVVHGIAIGVIPDVRGTQLLYGAQVANSAFPPRRKRR